MSNPADHSFYYDSQTDEYKQPRTEGPIPVNLPDSGPEVGDLGFEDIEAAFNMRTWLQKACEAAGGKMTGGGFGGGCADLWIELEGHEYMVTIKPVKK